ncbi:MAG: hypothetical protein GC154_15735 [bacterium]|nr:hypothetical protein [bacterium]
MSSSEKPLFREVQYFRQWWLWLIITISFGSALGGSIFDFINKAPESRSMNELLFNLAITGGIGLIVILLMLTMKLTTEVRKDGLYIQFFPLQFSTKEISTHRLTRCEARTYSPIWEYGGWGIRFTFRNGTAYNVSGNEGVQLEYEDGKKILIGSQDAKKLQKAIQSITEA